MALMKCCFGRLPLCYRILQSSIYCNRHFHINVFGRKLKQRLQHCFVQYAHDMNMHILRSSCMSTSELPFFKQKMLFSSNYDHNQGNEESIDTIMEQEGECSQENDTFRKKQINKRLNLPVTNTKVDEVLAKYNIEEFYGIDATVEHEIQPPREELIPIPVTRGKDGVFDINEIVTVLNDENILDVCVVRVPPDIKYVNFMVLGTGKSARHIRAAAEQFKWIWKKKRNSRDPPTLHIEGLESSNWLAMDMGNVALHLFLKDTRELYDLESLWTCGHEFDQIDDQYTVYLTSNTSLQSSKQQLIEKLVQSQSTNFSNLQEIEFEEDFEVVNNETYVEDDINHLVKLKYMTKNHVGDSMENKGGYHKVTLDQD